MRPRPRDLGEVSKARGCPGLTVELIRAARAIVGEAGGTASQAICDGHNLRPGARSLETPPSGDRKIGPIPVRISIRKPSATVANRGLSINAICPPSSRSISHDITDQNSLVERFPSGNEQRSLYFDTSPQ